MPILKYKYSESDPVKVRKAIVGNREYLFVKADGGTCKITDEKDAHWLLRNTSNYEVVKWCDSCEAEQSVLPGEPVDDTKIVVAKRGRPRKS